LLKLFPSVGGRLEPLGGPRSPSSKTFRRNWYFSWVYEE
jgi:hypothetical protein